MPPPPRETKHHPASVDLELIKRLLQVGEGVVLPVGGRRGGQRTSGREEGGAYCRKRAHGRGTYVRWRTAAANLYCI